MYLTNNASATASQRVQTSTGGTRRGPRKHRKSRKCDWHTYCLVNRGDAFLSSVGAWVVTNTVGDLVAKGLIISNLASLVAQMVKNPPAMRETKIQSLGWEDLLKEDMATHSSILVWRIPMDRGLGELQSTGSQRAGHNWATKNNLGNHPIGGESPCRYNFRHLKYMGVGGETCL